MAVNWPAALPQQPATYSEKPKPVMQRTQPDSGPTKARRRFTKMARTGQMSFLLTIDQWLTLKTFFEDTMDSGATPMNFVHPWEQVSKEMYITDTPAASSDGPLGVSVSFPVEFF